MKKIIFLLVGLALFTFNSKAQTVSDFDGNVYNTVTIGTQIWMKENLKTTHYSDGAAIPLLNNKASWDTLTKYGKACCWYNDDIANKNIYGAFYTWAAAMNGAAGSSANPSGIQGACPTGWHLPSEAEWGYLRDFLGGILISGGKLKETGTTHWMSPNGGATNETGFTALPAGLRNQFGDFGLVGQKAYFWCADEDSITTAWMRFLGYKDGNLARSRAYMYYGLSVRCLKDTPSEINEINSQEKIDIYPNPAIDKIYINCAEKQNLKMQVYNSVGQCVLQKELSNKSNTVDISSLTRGIYIIKLITPDGTYIKKIIKE